MIGMQLILRISRMDDNKPLPLLLPLLEIRITIATSQRHVQHALKAPVSHTDHCVVYVVFAPCHRISQLHMTNTIVVFDIILFPYAD